MKSALCFVVALLIASPLAMAESCELELAPVPFAASFQRVLRAIGDFTFGAEVFLPAGVSVRPGEVNVPDQQAALTSLKNGKREVKYFEVVKKDGTLVFRSEFQIGSLTQVDGYDHLKELLRIIRENHLENQPLIIRDVHTHPLLPGSSRFSSADVSSTLLTHAILELSGLNNFEIESSILYIKITQMNYVKKTMHIPAGTISYPRGDYTLGRKLDALLRSLPPAQLKNIGQML